MTSIMTPTTAQITTSRITHVLLLLIAILVVLLLVSLSLWQFKRGLAKQNLKSEFSVQQSEPVLDSSALSMDSQTLNYRKIKLSGKWLNKYTLLLDNQTHQGQVGYQILVPLEYHPNQWILVHRGWIPASNSRNQLPDIPTIEQNSVIEGTLRIPSKRPFIQEIFESQPPQWPCRIQAIHFDQLSQVIPGIGTSYILYPDPNHAQEVSIILGPLQLPETWLTPERHFAYAAQWGLLAVALIFILIKIVRLSREKIPY